MYRYITDGGYKNPEHEQTEDVSGEVAVKGLHIISMENALFRAVDTGDMSEEEAKQVLDDYMDAFCII